MRLAVVSLLFVLSTPWLERAPLTADQVGRFVAAAEEVVAVTPPSGEDALADELLHREEALAIAMRHGFSAGEWRRVGQRVLAAHRAARLSDLPEGKGGGVTRKLASMPDAAGNEMGDLQTVLRMAERDRAQRAKETEQDRAVIEAEQMGRLDALAARTRL
ncbi:MAG TPA: hypothetical protein VED40_19925 [Azospirillaceae bacterium]|nr:hypothetical protein [Azospirillaceae bacterium]